MMDRRVVAVALLALAFVNARPENTEKKEERKRQAQLQIRLVGRSVPSEGRVEVKIGGDGWGTVCDDWWEDVDAQVACRMLGFTGGVALQGAAFGEGVVPIKLDNVECTGDESSLWDCEHNVWEDHNCGHSEDASIVCDHDPSNNATGPSIRLVDGSGSHEGRLEVYINGEWGTVCDDWFERVDATVVCSELGLTGGDVAEYEQFPSGSGSILLDNVECTGHEASILDCEANAVGDNNCGRSEDVGVICDLPEPVQTIRLVGGSGPHEGRVEIQVDGEWGTVCDDWFEPVDAAVVCAELGLSGGEVASFGEGEGDILLDNVECEGGEASILECRHNGIGDNNCGHHEDVGVICDTEGSGAPVLEVSSVRLANGDGPGRGRVEVLHEGVWGTVCDDAWDDVDASVVCQQLGFSAGVALEDNEYGDGVDPVWLDEVDCAGGEESLSDCHHAPWGEHDCSHYEDAGVICS